MKPKICCDEMKIQGVGQWDVGIRYSEEDKDFYSMYDDGCGSIGGFKFCPWCAKPLELAEEI